MISGDGRGEEWKKPSRVKHHRQDQDQAIGTITSMARGFMNLFSPGFISSAGQGHIAFLFDDLTVDRITACRTTKRKAILPGI